MVHVRIIQFNPFCNNKLLVLLLLPIDYSAIQAMQFVETNRQISSRY
jgi:hypothetical protein